MQECHVCGNMMHARSVHSHKPRKILKASEIYGVIHTFSHIR
jgi:hypothetical protein